MRLLLREVLKLLLERLQAVLAQAMQSRDYTRLEKVRHGSSPDSVFCSGLAAGPYASGPWLRQSACADPALHHFLPAS
jgi:hypothetical protein